MGRVQTPESEERQGKAVVDVASTNGVHHFVYISVERGANSDTDPTNVPHLISKYNTEKHLANKHKGSDMIWTVLLPTAFFEGLEPNFIDKAFKTRWDISLKSDQGLQVIAISDIGYRVARYFLKTDVAEFGNKSISLAGAEPNFNDMRKILEEKTGSTLPTTYKIFPKLMH